MLEILKFTIPSVVILIGLYFVINKLFKQESERRQFELYKLNRDVTLPIKMRAYERITLFLQRTSPESILMRFDFSSLTVVQLQQLLLQSLRDEFEHNASQQIYVSQKTWVMVLNARESIAQLINSTAVHLNPQAPAIDLAQAILASYAASDNPPTEIALEYLRSELKSIGL